MAQDKYKYYYQNKLVAKSSRDSYRYALIREKENGDIVKYSLSCDYNALVKLRIRIIDIYEGFAHEYKDRNPESIAEKEQKIERLKLTKIVEIERR